MATIGQIADGESGVNVRTKLNSSITESNKVEGKADKEIIVEVKGGDYTLIESDNGKLIQVSAAATITMPAGLSSGFNCNVEKTGTGNVLFTSGAEALFISKESYNQLITQYEKCEVLHAGADTFTVYGLESDSTAPPGGGEDDPVVIVLKQLAATGLQTLTVTAGYSVDQILVVVETPGIMGGTVSVKIGTASERDDILRVKDVTAADPSYLTARAYITPAGVSADWALHLTTGGGTANIYVKTSKLV